MRWRLYHKLFGWDYIQWENLSDQGVARVFVDGTGAPYYWRYWNIGVADGIASASQVRWLTCHPSKYLPTEEQK